ncbi:hypothetical protein AGLY_017039 [Aphis glycines]|uniref:DNA helicase Pif1-like 2B domain-containing protein n=1 Tax=Aphis glycines TaxID=307491 RepID=A0A6G0SW68_APHGL|nr:hypothetical protein AGLY_017039 [Aphis glycines]
MSERAILAAKNKDVDSLNFTIQSKIAGELRSYKSVDSMIDENEAVNYPIEFLNSLDVPGTPPHNLQVKVGSIIIMLRNLNPPTLCNGTRLSVKKLMNNAIQSTIIKGNFKGEEVLIPRIPIIPTDLPFQFKRIQFPVRLAFAMTINKSQGQSLEVCGINLKCPCFSHGQLYVASSRVGKPSSLFIFAPENKTKNIKYDEVVMKLQRRHLFSKNQWQPSIYLLSSICIQIETKCITFHQLRTAGPIWLIFLCLVRNCQEKVLMKIHQKTSESGCKKTTTTVTTVQQENKLY